MLSHFSARLPKNKVAQLKFIHKNEVNFQNLCLKILFPEIIFFNQSKIELYLFFNVNFQPFLEESGSLGRVGNLTRILKCIFADLIVQSNSF